MRHGSLKNPHPEGQGKHGQHARETGRLYRNQWDMQLFPIVGIAV